VAKSLSTGISSFVLLSHPDSDSDGPIGPGAADSDDSTVDGPATILGVSSVGGPGSRNAVQAGKQNKLKTPSTHERLRQASEKTVLGKVHKEVNLMLMKMKHHFELMESPHPERAEQHRMELEAKTRVQAELARSARIGMGEAIRIAMSQQAGTVMESRLVRKGDEVFYHVLILSGTEADPVSTWLLISAVNGRIAKP